jgi:hypothetical protein
MTSKDRKQNRAPEPNVDANTRDENQHKPEKQRPESGREIEHGSVKSTDTPATMDAEYAEREKGKRTTL